MFPICLWAYLLQAQMHDNNWILGASTGPGPGDEFGVTDVNFSNGNIQTTENFVYRGAFLDNNTVYSDSSGKLFSIFNGYRVTDSRYTTMINGDSLFHEYEHKVYGYCSTDLPQGGLFLPWPDHLDSLFLLYNSLGNAGTNAFVISASLHLQYAIIKKSGNGGLGEVVQRRVVVLEDTIQLGKLLATKHANGRDWWLPINEQNTNRYYMYLIDPQGIHLSHRQTIGLPVIDGLGQACFSPDGRYFAVANTVDDSIGSFLDIYEFDRCAGLFIKHRQIHFSESPYAMGCAFSRNSRFLYMNTRLRLYQYDMQSPDLEVNKVLIATYVPPPPGEYPATFYQMQLAPDNKIYISGTNSLRALSVIHRPDEAGSDCQFERAGLKLPVNNLFSVSYSPNYRLGPLDGSPCDTLSLNNVPVAWYRYQQDTLEPLLVDFHDLSHHEPASWHWDFGDPTSGASNTAMERHPAHLYTAPGKYEACLTVRNVYGAHTHCKTLFLGVTPSENPVLQEQVQVSPNPFSERISVAFSATNLRQPVFLLYDATGRLVRREPLSLGIHEVETGDLPKGVYFWAVEALGRVGDPPQRVKGGKVVKME